MIAYRRLAILIVILTSPPSMAFADSSWYVAADVGNTSYAKHAEADGNLYFGDKVSTPVFSDDDRGHRFAFGYRIDPYLAVEVGYVDLGSTTSDVNVFGSPSAITCGLPCAINFTDVSTLKAHGDTAELTGTLPLGEGWSLYARAGLFRVHAELDNSIVVPPTSGSAGGQVLANKTADSSQHTYGAGARWSFAQDWGLRLGWDRYSSIGGASDWDSSVNFTSLGLEYDF